MKTRLVPLVLGLACLLLGGVPAGHGQDTLQILLHYGYARNAREPGQTGATLSCCESLASWSNHEARDSGDQIAARMKAQLDQALPYIMEELADVPEPGDIEIVDDQTGYRYSQKEGLRWNPSVDEIAARMKAQLDHDLPYIMQDLEDLPGPGDIEIVDDQTGYRYSQKEGLRWTDPTRAAMAGLVVPLALYQPYRKIVSEVGWKKVEASLVLPSQSDLGGVDGPGEAVHNCFGCLVIGVGDYEVGLTSQYGYGDGQRWFVFHTFNGNQTWDQWPPGGIPSGTTVFMKMFVPQNGQLGLYVSYDSMSRLFTYTAPGTRQDGLGQRLRRVTSLCVNDHGWLLNNEWQNVKIGKNPQDTLLWTPSDTYCTDTTSYVCAFETNPYYNERVSICVP